MRDAGVEDAAALAPLLASLGYPDEPAAIAARIAAVIGAGDRILLAEEDGAIVGFSVLHVTPMLHKPYPIGRITAFVVDEALRGRGIGARMVAASEEALFAAGCGAIELTSAAHRTGAHHFYERLGYSEKRMRFWKDRPR